MPAEVSQDTMQPALSQSFGRGARRVPLEDRAVGFIKNYFTTGNVMVKVDAIVLFFGVAFLLKYAAEHTQVPIEFRLLGVVLGAIALLVFGWRLRHTRTNYGLILQGAGIGVLYLTIFAALRLYQLLPAGGAFFLLFGIVAFSAILAIKQDSRALASAVVLALMERRFDWPIAKLPALGLICVLAAFAAVDVLSSSHPLLDLGIVAWPAAIAAYCWILKRYDDALPITALHSMTLWLSTALATWEVAWQIDRAVAGAGTWPLIAWLIVPTGVVLLLITQGKRIAWPVVRHWHDYLLVGCAPLVVFVALWSLAANFLSDGDPAPLFYVPLLNPLNIAQGFAFSVMVRWLLRARSEQWSLPKTATVGAISVLAFVWVNAMLVRTLHFWAGISLNLESMWQSTLAQTSLSIFWSVLALCVMVFATRKALRHLWLIGAALMGVVVLKLFTIDISNIGGLTRIVSFIGVAVLLLVIGYFSPVPPKHEEKMA